MQVRPLQAPDSSSRPAAPLLLIAATASWRPRGAAVRPTAAQQQEDAAAATNPTAPGAAGKVAAAGDPAAGSVSRRSAYSASGKVEEGLVRHTVVTCWLRQDLAAKSSTAPGQLCFMWVCTCNGGWIAAGLLTLTRAHSHGLQTPPAYTCINTTCPGSTWHTTGATRDCALASLRQGPPVLPRTAAHLARTWGNGHCLCRRTVGVWQGLHCCCICPCSCNSTRSGVHKAVT